MTTGNRPAELRKMRVKIEAEKTIADLKNSSLAD